MTDLDRVLDSLLHDLRSPLGVASGYLRLLEEGRLKDPAEAERVLGKAQDALRMMSTLCAAAATWLAPDPVACVNRVGVAHFAEVVAGRIGHATVPIHRSRLTGELALRDETDRVAAAVAAVLVTVAQARERRGMIAIHVSDGVLRFDVNEPSTGMDRPAFDPWERGGLLVPLACRTIRFAGGDWRAPGRDGATVSITFDSRSLVGEEHG